MRRLLHVQHLLLHMLRHPVLHSCLWLAVRLHEWRQLAPVPQLLLCDCVGLVLLLLLPLLLLVLHHLLLLMWLPQRLHCYHLPRRTIGHVQNARQGMAQCRLIHSGFQHRAIDDPLLVAPIHRREYIWTGRSIVTVATRLNDSAAVAAVAATAAVAVAVAVAVAGHHSTQVQVHSIAAAATAAVAGHHCTQVHVGSIAAAVAAGVARHTSQVQASKHGIKAAPCRRWCRCKERRCI